MIAWKYTLTHLFSWKNLFLILCIGVLYVGISILLLNAHFVWTTIIGNYPLLYKLTILETLIIGSWEQLSSPDFVYLLLTALLVGLNMLLSIQTIYDLKHKGRIRLSIGGASIIGIVTTGCSSCGISLLSLLGLSATVSFLPFHGTELHIVVIMLLGFSFFSMLFQLHKGAYCTLAKMN